MAEKKPKRGPNDDKLPTVSGESLGSGPDTPTNIGRDGHVLVQSKVMLGRADSGLRFAPPADSASPEGGRSASDEADHDDDPKE